MLNETDAEDTFCRIFRFPVITLVVLLAASSAARGQLAVFTLDTLKAEYLLNDYLRVWEDTTEAVTFETVSSPAFNDLFQPYNQVKPLPHRRGVYWGKAIFTNHFKQPGLVKNWFLWTGDGSYIDIFIASQDGSLREHLKTGELVPAREKKLATGNRVERAPFSLAMGDTVAVYFRLQLIDQKQPEFKVRLTQDDYLEGAHALEKNREDWLFLGFLVAITIFSLMLFLSTGDKAFLFHSLFLFSAMVFLLDMLGIMPDLPVLRDHQKWTFYLNYLSQACWDVFFLQFFRTYMRLENCLPWWDQVLKNLIRLRIVYFIAVFSFFVSTLNEGVTDNLSIFYVFAQYLVILVFLAALYRLRDPKAYFLILATLFFITGVVVNGCLITIGKPINRLFSEGAVVGEILLFSIGLAYRMKQLQEEEKAAQRLKDLDELKNRFYTNITHEFRNPLTVINGMVEQLMKKPAINPERMLQLIRQNSGHLLDLVNRLLNLTKIESGHRRMHPSNGDWVAYLRQLVEFFQPLATQKGITLRFLTQIQSLEMAFDAEIIRQIFTNLLSNAIKFTPENGSITVSVEQSGGKVTAVVSDSGMGIPAADLPHIFERFFQAQNAMHWHGPGTGIGLALTRELVVLTGGTIEVKSKEGSGSTFTVTLPIEHLPEENLALKPTTPATKQEEWKPEIPLEFESLPAVAAIAQKELVLVIEDNPHIVQYLRVLLEDTFEVETAFNGKDGIDLALETIPDLIVSDVIMPQMDGFDVLETLKKDTRTSHIPIVLLTALASVKDRIAGLERGADAYLGKPFEGRELLAILNNLLEQRRRFQTFFQKENGTPPDELTGGDTREDEFLKTLKDMVETNLADEDFGVIQLQRAMAVSRTQLHRKLKALTGMSTTGFINHLRLKKACQLLRNPDLHIGEIAYDTGFKDPNYFTRLFVKFYGKTPTDYRYELANATLKATDSNADTKHEKH